MDLKLTSKINFSADSIESTMIDKMPAANWRFGASGGVAPQKVQWEYER